MPAAPYSSAAMKPQDLPAPIHASRWRATLCLVAAVVMLLAASQLWLHTLATPAASTAPTAAEGSNAAPPALVLALAGLGLLVFGLGKPRASERQAETAPDMPAASSPAASAPEVAWRERLSRTMAHAATHPDYGFAVLALQLDAAEPAASSLGDAAPAELTLAVQRRLDGCLRPCDAACRREGADFGYWILLDGLANPGQLDALVHDLHAEMAEPYTVCNHPLRLRERLAVVPSAAAASDIAQLLLDAERTLADSVAGPLDALPAASYFSPELGQQQAVKRSAKQAFERALSAGEFELRFQPVFELASARFVGMRAHTEWQHPRRGLLAGAELQAEAGAAACAALLDDWQLRQAASAWSTCRARGALEQAGTPGWISLALSPDIDAPQRLAEMLKSAALPLSEFELRIGEPLLAADPAAAAALQRLRASGVRLALEGLSQASASLSMLTRLPLSAVTIDRHFVHQAGAVEAHAVLILAIVSLGATLGISTVADGIEDTSQQTLMQELGVELGLGAQLAPTLSAADFAGWLPPLHG